ncbi:MAG TPA: alpha/beta fold hydrolase [Actinophytocola sp.]|nr:alpha/beta fold hydrolase [Actinophytocola sp.]
MPQHKAGPVVAFIPPSCAGAGYFRPLRRVLGERVDFRAVELPGHGRRYREDPLTVARDAARDVADRLGGPVDAIYGESLGAYVGLAVTALLDQPRPPLLLAAANSPPSVRERIRTEDADSIESAVAMLAAMGGQIPTAVVDDPELARQAFPLMRADLHLSQSFIERTRELRVAGDIHVLGGTADTALCRLESWADHTTGHCSVNRLPGGHLLSATNPTGVAEVVLRSLDDR